MIKWAAKPSRKPLVIRGARQVGKTTLVAQFSHQFDQYIYLNLELPDDSQAFLDFKNMDTLIQSIFFIKNKVHSKKKKTLIFIDEIQEVPKALNLLRYFYEQAPELYVIAAGSLLETLFSQNVSFPVGRLEFLVVRPVSFSEFLAATGEHAALQAMRNIPLPEFANEKLFALFNIYTLIGGMPEIVDHYATHKDLTSLKPIYESLIVSYIDDVEKYAANATQVQLFRHVIKASFAEAGKRIKFQGFGKSNYRSREMGEVLRNLQKAFLLYLVYPTTGAELPLQPDSRKSPRLQVLDTGMLNYFLGIQKELLWATDLNKVYQGTVIEHIVGQELLAIDHSVLNQLNFWIREKKESSAEVDYLYLFEGKVIPVEVKSGSAGKLRSLHLFMDLAPHNMAIRFYAGEISITEVNTLAGKKYFLLNLPYFLVSQIEYYLTWFKNKINEK